MSKRKRPVKRPNVIAFRRPAIALKTDELPASPSIEDMAQAIAEAAVDRKLPPLPAGFGMVYLSISYDLATKGNVADLNYAAFKRRPREDKHAAMIREMINPLTDKDIDTLMLVLHYLERDKGREARS